MALEIRIGDLERRFGAPSGEYGGRERGGVGLTFGVEFDRAPVRGDRVFDVPQILQHQAEIAQHVGRIRPYAEGEAIRGGGQFQPVAIVVAAAKIEEANAGIVVRIEVFRVDFDRFLVGRDRVLEPPHLLQHEALVVMRLGVVGARFGRGPRDNPGRRSRGRE